MFDTRLAYAQFASNIRVNYQQGKYEQAEQFYQRALHIREQTFGCRHPEVAYPLNGLANLYREQGKYGEAEPLYQRALHIREQQLGPDHPATALSLNNLGTLYSRQRSQHLLIDVTS